VLLTRLTCIACPPFAALEVEHSSAGIFSHQRTALST